MEKEYEMLKLDNQLCFPLYAAARRVVGLYTPYLKPLGLTYTQYIVLMVLWEDENITTGELCRRLYLDSGTLNPLLKKLTDRGFVTRQRSSEDERVIIVAITEEGQALREKLKEVPQKIGSCVSLSEEDMKEMYTLLYKVLKNM
jgi:DNA-binding MarR family transcriptional regulator